MWVESLVFWTNPQLTFLVGLEGLTSVGEDRYIHNNPLLSSLGSLGSVAQVSRSVEIPENEVKYLSFVVNRFNTHITGCFYDYFTVYNGGHPTPSVMTGTTVSG